MGFASLGGFAHFLPGFLGTLDIHEHQHEELVAFEDNLTNRQRERTLASFELAATKEVTLLAIFSLPICNWAT